MYSRVHTGANNQLGGVQGALVSCSYHAPGSKREPKTAAAATRITKMASEAASAARRKCGSCRERRTSSVRTGQRNLGTHRDAGQAAGCRRGATAYLPVTLLHQVATRKTSCTSERSQMAVGGSPRKAMALSAAWT